MPIRCFTNSFPNIVALDIRDILFFAGYMPFLVAACPNGGRSWLFVAFWIELTATPLSKSSVNPHSPPHLDQFGTVSSSWDIVLMFLDSVISCSHTCCVDNSKNDMAMIAF